MSMRRPGWQLLAGIALLAGAGTAIAGLLASPAARAPAVPIPATARPSAVAPATTRGPRAAVTPPVPGIADAPTAPPMSFSAPVRVEVPAIEVDAPVIPLGVNPDGTAQVPSLDTPQLTSWFDDGPAPGQQGPAAIFGHVNTAAGPAVFFRVGALVPGDTVNVIRADGSVARFQVYRVVAYAKDAFPTMTVYGDTPGAELRLITCGGAFHAATGSYADNVVAYARLVRYPRGRTR